MEYAKPVTDEILVAFESWGVLSTPCSYHEQYLRLPQVIRYRNANYGRTGWNSDVGKAYYKQGVQTATVVKR